MPTLALDTTTRAGSVALVAENGIVAERPGDEARSHAERLPRELTALLDEIGLTLADVDLFAVAAGPGSFTGLRIGIATIQGLAFVTRRPIVAVSALEALAQAAGASLAPDSLVGVWMDAHRGDVFSALFRVMAAEPFTPERLALVEEAAVGAPAAIAGRWQKTPPGWLVGDGAVRYASAFGGAGASGPRIMEPPRLAGAIGRLAGAVAARGGAVAPHGVRPVYVRRPDAVIARDRNA